jgi:hypothetical protein
MSKMSRPVVTPSAPKAWHPKTSTKKVFWGAGSRAMPRAPRFNSVPALASADPLGGPDCRQGKYDPVGLLGDIAPKVVCCGVWDPSNPLVKCYKSNGDFLLSGPTWSSVRKQGVKGL